MFRSWSFRALCAGVLLVFGLTIGAVGVSIWRDRSDAIDSGVRDASNIAVVLAGQIERLIQSVDIVLRGAQRRVDELDVWSADGTLHLPDIYGFRQALLQQMRSLPQALHTILVDPRGQIVVSTSEDPRPAINIADREYFKELAANNDDRLAISLPLKNRITGEQTIVLARRISDANGGFLGVVLISVTKRYFEGIYGAVESLSDQTFALQRRDGTILVRYPDARDRTGKIVPSMRRFQAAVESGGGSYRSVGAFDPAIRWIAVNPLKEYALVVAISVPEAVMLQGWRTRAVVTGAVTLALFACALILLSIILAREAQLWTQNQRFDAALTNMSNGLAMFDVDARLLVCNERYRRMLGLTPEQTQPGASLRDTMLCRDVPADVDAVLPAILSSVSRFEPHLHEIDGVDGRVIAVKNDPMPGGGWVATFVDITERRANEAKIKLLAHYDLLTGVANRPQFLEEIEKARVRLRADGWPFTVLMLDLDRFKDVNDSLGHAAGDALLQEMAKRLQASLRSVDVLARLGGDEFAIIQTPPREFEPVEDAGPIMREAAIVLASRIINTIGEPFDIDGRKVVVGASVGIAMAPFDAVETDDLMKKADLALYRIKAEGRNGYSLFDAEMAIKADERHRLELDLREGLTRNEFELYYQPLVDVATRRTCCMEALVRWNHPTRGLVAPDRFISLAEDTGLITSLGEWILQTACAEAAKWPSDVKVAVNISPAQFRKTNLLDVILCALVESGLPPERLEIEITERVLLDKDADYLSTLHQLRNLGIAVALDDFGTGYSSLSYLNMFPFNKIKIDRSFTSELLERSECAAIVCAVIGLGRSLDIATTAEGVESAAQFQALRAAGVTQAQGYLFGRPAPACELQFDRIASFDDDRLRA